MEHMSFAKGISWFDDCRIPFVDEKDPSAKRYETPRNSVEGMFNTTVGFKGEYDYKEQTGRFPANILVCDDMLNDGIDRKGFNGGGGPSRFANATGGKKLDDYNYYGDKGSSSRYYDIDKWFDKLLDSCG